MRITTLVSTLVILASLGAAPAANAQTAGDSMMTNMVAWFTGDPSVGDGPSQQAPDAPKLYAEDTCCADGCCGCCSQCCKCYDTFGSIEYLMWWGRGTSLPPLVTASPAGTPAISGGVPIAGVLGQPTTDILFGNQLAGQKMQSGGRVTAGIWLDPDHNVAAGGRFFGLGGDTTNFSATSAGGATDRVLGVPFTNVLPNTPPFADAFLVALNGTQSGTITAKATTNNILGADAFAEIMMSRDSRRRIDLVGGYQFFRLDDGLQLNTNSQLIDPTNPLFGTTISTTDRFTTHNQFHGGQIGLRARMARGQWSLNTLGVVGLGNMNEQVIINGSNTVTSFGVPSTTAGGIFTQPTNIGTHTQNRFAAIPQLISNLNYHVTPTLSFHIGYNMMWITNIALSGDQIDTRVNSTQFFGGNLAGPARPHFQFNDRDYWLQGINYGMNWDF
ncbi:MAG TPA: BBP7 family outer membrane beta-barrel protein [Pirellulaceae bacterium]